ncbi:MAG TPA: helix-turn-helix domain-containing protein [Bordetella sp.]|uniref:helix-turn-helix domain-containing protein n=1 Tax=Bordetella sp. TaxID=28081 RepID=UPI002ED28C08
MDSLIQAAAVALAHGDVLAALKHVALRDDPPALALRGIAMAQLGDFERAKALLRSAAQAFSQKDELARARCIVAEAEIALVSRDLSWPSQALDAAWATLATHGDVVNAAYARNLSARRLLLIGRLDQAERLLAEFDPAPLPSASRAAYELTLAGIAIRRLKTKPASAAFARAAQAARQAAIPALTAEVEGAAGVLHTPAARAIAGGEERFVLLEEAEALLQSDVLVVDACRNAVHGRQASIPLATRPILFALARILGEAWPGDVSRETLLARAFRARRIDESHRARLRVEMGRLRAQLHSLAQVNATKRGFALAPHHAEKVIVLAPLVDEHNAAVLALLADGEAWSSSALAIALGASPRTVQRALEQLAAAGKAQSFGGGRARRWTVSSVPGFPTALLLPVPLPGG